MTVICGSVLILQGSTQARNQARLKLNLPVAAGHPRGAQTWEHPQRWASALLLDADLSPLRQVQPEWFTATAGLIRAVDNPLTGN